MRLALYTIIGILFPAEVDPKVRLMCHAVRSLRGLEAGLFKIGGAPSGAIAWQGAYRRSMRGQTVELALCDRECKRVIKT